MSVTIDPSGEGGSKGPGIAARGCQSLFFLVFLCAGLAFTAFLAAGFIQKLRPYLWTATPCAIVRGEMKEVAEGGRGPCRFEVEYAYTWNGRRYSGVALETGEDGSSMEYADAQRLAETYKPGANAACYVNPSNPGEAVLRRGSLWVFLFVIIPLIFVAVGAWGIYTAWRRRPDENAAAAPVSSLTASRGERFAPYFFLIFSAFGAVFLVFAFILPMIRILDAKSWTETPCVVLASQVRGHSDSDGTTYRIDILYAYRVGGREYKSNRYDFMAGSSSGRDGKQAVVDRHPPGTKTICYVNPKDPTDAVLDRGVTSSMGWGLIPLSFVLIGLVGFAFARRSARRRAASPQARWMPAAAGPGRGGDRPASSGQGPVTLKSGASPLGLFVGAVAVALFWNGIVSVFAWKAVDGIGKGEWDFGWFLAIFLIPFVAVGLVLIGFVGRQFLALFNPRPALTVGAVAIPLGGATDLAWKVEGRSRRIRRLRIDLEGREEATCRRGKEASTDTRLFARISLVDARDPYEIRSGRATLRVPAQTMHSFESASNKILWALKVRGEIDRWPDVEAHYPITVLPGAGETQR